MKTQRCNQPTHTIPVCFTSIYHTTQPFKYVGKYTNRRPMMSRHGKFPMVLQIVESDANMSTEMRLCAEMAWKP